MFWLLYGVEILIERYVVELIWSGKSVGVFTVAMCRHSGISNRTGCSDFAMLPSSSGSSAFALHVEVRRVVRFQMSLASLTFPDDSLCEGMSAQTGWFGVASMGLVRRDASPSTANAIEYCSIRKLHFRCH